MLDMSRMPDMAMFSVRGIGVAESVSTSTPWDSALMCSLWATPKRCSSSTTSSPRFLKLTSLDSSRCVPMTRSHLPFFSSSSTFALCAPVRKRLRTSMVTGKPKKRCSAV